jgi:hypothetical protein
VLSLLCALSVQAQDGYWVSLEKLAPLTGTQVIGAEASGKSVVVQTEEGTFVFLRARFQRLTDIVGSNISSKQLTFLKSANGVWIIAPGQALYFLSHDNLTDLTRAVTTLGPHFSVINQDREMLWLNDGGRVVMGVSEGKRLTRSQVPPVFGDEKLLFVKASGSENKLWFASSERIALVSSDRVQVVVDFSKSIDIKSSIKLTHVGQNGDLWILLEQDNRILRANVATGALESKQLSDAAVELVETLQGAIWVATKGDGIQRFVDGKWQEISKKSGTLLGDDVTSLAYDRDTNLISAGLGESGFVLFQPDGASSHYASQANGLALRNVSRVQSLGKGRFLLSGADRVLQVIDGGKFSAPLALSGGILNVSDTQDGTVWVAGLSGISRYAIGKWFDFRIPNAQESLVRRVLQIGEGDYFVDSAQLGPLLYSPPKARLRLAHVDEASRTVTISADGVPNLDRSTVLQYNLSSTRTTVGPEQRISFLGTRAAIAVPLELGEDVYIRALAVDSAGNVLPMQSGEDALRVNLPISPTTRLWKATVDAALKWVPLVALIHVLLWLMLLAAYPYSRTVQSTLFWNRSVRKFLGLWYIELLILTVPPLRSRMIQPFMSALTADARMESLDTYYDRLRFRREDADIAMLPSDVAKSIKGHTVICGPSGSGKTHLMRFLIAHRNRTAAFVPARSCAKGVIEAIAEKLPPSFRDLGLLETLVFHGAFDIYIDGLNEVNADVRERIYTFLVTYSHAKVILSTQRFKWNVPSNCAVLDVQPLNDDEVREYLLRIGPETSSYQRAVLTYSAEKRSRVSGPTIVNAEGGWPITTPFDLTIVSRLLVLGVQPNEFDLQEQYLSYVSARFANDAGESFPMAALSEVAYVAKKDGTRAAHAEVLSRSVIELLLEERILLRSIENPEQLLFRHDRIQDYLTTQYLLRHPDLQLQYLDDVRFIGVYSLLAEKLSSEDARILLSHLAYKATQDRDSTILYEFVERLRAFDTAYGMHKPIDQGSMETTT